MSKVHKGANIPSGFLSSPQWRVEAIKGSLCGHRPSSTQTFHSNLAHTPSAPQPPWWPIVSQGEWQNVLSSEACITNKLHWLLLRNSVSQSKHSKLLEPHKYGISGHETSSYLLVGADISEFLFAAAQIYRMMPLPPTHPRSLVQPEVSSC